MDLETENRLAALLMEEARRLRAEADREGVGVYLRKPNVRGRPNSRFLTATVLGIEQANRAVQVNEMWRAREKELELEAKLKSRSKDKDVRHSEKDHTNSRVTVSSLKREEESCRSSFFPSCSKRGHDDHYSHSSDEGGLKDDEVEEFLRSRAKRGRGAIGSRMDEPGPYLLAASSDHSAGKPFAEPDAREREEWGRRVLGPEKPPFIESHYSLPERVRAKKKHHPEEKKKKKLKERKSGRRNDKERRKQHRHHKSRRSRGDSE